VGESGLQVEAAILSTRQAVEIAYTKQDGEIKVGAGAQGGSEKPSAGKLILAGAAVLALLVAAGTFLYVLRRRR
jgi:hypothetical protein